MKIQNYSLFEITLNFNPSKITTHTVLDAADWSLEGTFQRFDSRNLKGEDQTTFGTAVLSSHSSSNNTC